MPDNYKLSQDYEIIPPQKQRSYPISTTEWDLIKKKVSEIKNSSNLWQTIGAILIGSAIPTFISALIGDFNTEKSSWICWAAFFITAICGAMAFFFGKEQKEAQNKFKESVIDFMNTIEDRFQVIIPNGIPNSNNSIAPVYKIHTARYFAKDKSVDLTQKISELVAQNVLEIKATNELGGDPFLREQKTLEIEYSKNGIRKKVSVKENDLLKIE